MLPYHPTHSSQHQPTMNKLGQLLKHLSCFPSHSPPPSYAIFDPHPPDCACPIHIHRTHPIRPTIIESFQSQGSAASASATPYLLSLLADPSPDPNVLVLDYHVTYHDHLGWEDTAGNKAYDERQWDYARAMGRQEVRTPQVVVNGGIEGTGATKSVLEGLVMKGNRAASEGKNWLRFEVVEGGVRVERAEGRSGHVLEVLYDPHVREVVIGKGENAGKTLQERNIVRNLRVLGEWKGGEERVFELGRINGDGLERVVLLQEGIGGPIVGAARIA
jgi:hypothetical protein